MDKTRLLFALALATTWLSACQVATGPDAAAVMDSTATPEARTEAPVSRTPRVDTTAARAVGAQRLPLADTLLQDTPLAPVLNPAEVERRRVAALAALEDLSIESEGRNAQATSRALALMDERISALPEAARPVALDSLRRSARSADLRGDGVALALVAAKAHQALTAGGPSAERIHSEALVLSALSRAALPDWRAIRAASENLTDLWREAMGSVEADGLHDALGAALAGIRSGAETQNAPVVRLGADIVADLAAEIGQAVPS